MWCLRAVAVGCCAFLYGNTPRDSDVHPPCTTRFMLFCMGIFSSLMSTHYKVPWLVSLVSSAPAHIRIFQRHWLVSFQLFLSSPFDHTHSYALQPLHFRPHTHCIHAHIYISDFHIIILTCFLTKPSLSSCLLSLQHPPFRFLSCMLFAFHLPGYTF